MCRTYVQTIQDEFQPVIPCFFETLLRQFFSLAADFSILTSFVQYRHLYEFMGNYSVAITIFKSKKEKKFPFSVKINNRDFLNHVVVPNVRFVLRTVSTVLYCRTVGICTVHIRILYSTVNTSIYEYILYCIALYLCQGNDHIFRPCFLQYDILHCTLYSVLYT